LSRRGKGRAVPDRQLIRAEPKGPSLYQRKKGIETYSSSEEECQGGVGGGGSCVCPGSKQGQVHDGHGCQTGQGQGHLVAVKFCEVLPIRSTGTKIFEKY